MLRISVLTLFLLSAAVARADAPKRLIETAPGKRIWMTEGEISSLSKDRHDAGKCGGFFDVTDQEEEPPVLSSKDGFKPRVPNQQQALAQLLPLVTADRLFDSVKTLSAYKTRHYQSQGGVDAAIWLQKRFQSMARRRSDVTVTLYSHRFKQPSVVARIAGSGPRAAQKIVLGAHLDSITRTGTTAPGADDDASGIATLLEIFQILVQTGFRPDRTVEFIGFAGEEGGLLGSQQIAAQHQQQRLPVHAVMQFDMTMYPGSPREMTLITDYVDPELTRFTSMLIDTYVKAPWRRDRCGYGCSDHASWTRYGYASVMPFEAPVSQTDPYIHSPKDTIQWLDSTYGAQFAKLGLAFAVELATGD